MEKLFELTFQDQTLNPQVGTFTDVSQTTGTFTLEDGEYYLTNGDTKGFYTYEPIAIQPDSETDNKVIVEFDLKVATASVNTHAIIGAYAGVDGSGIPTGAKITLQYNAGDIELVLGSGTTATLIAAADVVVGQWYHFRIDCALNAPTESTYQVKIDGVSITTVTGATTDYELGIISVLGTDLHACDECGIKNIRLITDDDYFVGRTALNQAFTDTKGYVDNQVGACIPRAGGDVVTGSSLGRVGDTGVFQVCGGQTGADGGSITLTGKNHGASDGAVELTAYDGVDSTGVQVLPDGTMAVTYPDATVKNVAMQEDTVPRSGGAVLTGTSYARDVDNSYLSFYGGSEWLTGGMIFLSGEDNSTDPGAVQFIPSVTGYAPRMYLYPDGSWTWQGTACVVSSDRRIKDEISEIPDEILNAWESLEPKQYKLKSDLETDKGSAQTHYGWIAQDVESAIKGSRKGDVKSGLWLHQSWEEQEEVSHEETYTEESQTKDGTTETVIKTRKVIDQPYRAKGDSYGLRYTECLVVECAFLRKKLKELTTRIEQLEKGNNVK